MEDEDEELEFTSKEKGIFKRLVIVDVFKKYGIVYGIIALMAFLCHAILLVPIAAVLGYKSIEAMINWLSKGDKGLHDCYWAYLIVSLVGIVVIWATNKICDKVFAQKQKKVIS